MVAVPGFVEVELLVERLRVEIGQKGDAPGEERAAIGAANGLRWKVFVDVVIVVHGQAELLEIVHALGAAGGRAGGLQRMDEKLQEGIELAVLVGDAERELIAREARG